QETKLEAGVPESVTNHEAAKPNPSLQGLSVLVGSWDTVGGHPQIPDQELHGRTTFDWIEGGAFLIMRSEIDEPGVPSGIAIFVTGDTSGECSMLYFDERGVSRRYEASVHNQEWRWWRDTPAFSQRFIGEISSDGQTIVGRGEMSLDGADWQPDLQL